MRQIGIISVMEHAAIFSEYLHINGIDNKMESCTGGYSIWVEDEDDVAKGVAELQRYAANPTAAEYSQAHDHVRSGKNTSSAMPYVSQDSPGFDQGPSDRSDAEPITTATATPNPYLQLLKKPAPITLVLLIGSIFVAFATQLGDAKEITPRSILGTLHIAEPIVLSKIQVIQMHLLHASQSNPTGAFTEVDATRFLHPGAFQIRNANFYNIQRGELWRLVTPIFLHFSLLHIIFNMMALVVLGTAIEYRRGAFRFGLMVLVIAIGSNVAQFIMTGPSFGGMSGVVYGLFGYLWIKGKFDLDFGIRLNQQSITSMLLWLVLCMTGVLGPIANAAHVVGLIIGVILAAVSIGMKKKLSAPLPRP